MWLKHQQQAAGKRVHGFQCGRYLVRVVSKIVDYRYSIPSTHDLQPPTNTAELTEVRRGLREVYPACLRGAQGSECIRHIVQAWNFQIHRGGFTGVARSYLESDSGRRRDR